MRYNAVLFDFDGTFADTSQGILLCLNAALEQMGYPPRSMPEFRRFLGPPIQYSLREFAGMDENEVQRAVALYREGYAAGGCFRLRVYDGLEELLLRLRAAGVKTGIASSKPTVYLEQILRGIGKRRLLDAVCGTDKDHAESGKADIILEAARQCGVPPERCLMVGDRKFDIEGARAAGMASVGVLYGFGGREELEEAGADYIAEDCGALKRIVLG
ncbi:MAG: HAD-IA family hydrolase [Oscillospiraceae bacterium]|nr:HAD-IA family hydrolase [Oscillospiraceae bacterium]